MESNFAEKKSESLDRQQAEYNQMCGLAAKADSLGCMNRSSASRLSQVIISIGIHWIASERLHLLSDTREMMINWSKISGGSERGCSRCPMKRC